MSKLEFRLLKRDTSAKEFHRYKSTRLVFLLFFLVNEGFLTTLGVVSLDMKLSILKYEKSI